MSHWWDDFKEDLTPNTHSYENGVEIIYAKPGSYDKLHCKICKKEMEVSRNEFGATSYAHAMAIHHGKMKGSLRDVFTCPNAPKAWHRKKKSLIDEKEDTSSPSLKRLIQKDIDAIKEEN
jgi:hypothetical protein